MYVFICVCRDCWYSQFRIPGTAKEAIVTHNYDTILTHQLSAGAGEITAGGVSRGKQSHHEEEEEEEEEGWKHSDAGEEEEEEDGDQMELIEREMLRALEEYESKLSHSLSLAGTAAGHTVGSGTGSGEEGEQEGLFAGLTSSPSQSPWAPAPPSGPPLSHKEILELYMNVIHFESGNRRVYGAHEPRVKIRFESYSDPLLLMYISEQMRRLGAAGGAGSGGGRVEESPASGSGGRTATSLPVPITLPLYGGSYSTLPPHVIRSQGSRLPGRAGVRLGRGLHRGLLCPGDRRRLSGGQSLPRGQRGPSHP